MFEGSAWGQLIKVPHGKNPYREYLDSCGTLPKNRCENVITTMLHKSKPGGSIIAIQQDLGNRSIVQTLIQMSISGSNVAIVTTSRAIVRDQINAGELLMYGVELFTDDFHTAQNIFVIDNFYVVKGTIKADNLELLHNPTIADIYFNEWVSHMRHAKVVK